MKKTYLILFILLSWFVSFCQTRAWTPGFVPSANQTFVIEQGNLSARNGFFPPRFVDTTEALTYTLKDTLGNIVYLYSTHSLWVRSDNGVGGKKWVEIGAGGGSTPTLQEVITAGATLTGNNTIAGGGFNFNITNSHVALDAPGGNYFTLEDGGNDMVFSGQAGDIRLSTSGTGNFIHIHVGSGALQISGDTETDDLFINTDMRLGLGASASDLATPVNGQMYYNSATNKFRAYENGSWVNMIGLTNPMTTQGDIIIGGASGTPTRLAAGTTGYAFISNGPGVAPSWQEIPTDNLIIVNAPLSNVGPSTWFTSGDSLYMKRLKNTSTISWATDTDSSLLATIIDGSVTYAKIQNVTQARLLGRYTASTGVMQEISIGSGLSLDAGTGILTSTGGGDVTKVGTPVNNQVGIWTGDGTIEGVSAVQYNGTTFGIGGTMAASAILDLTSTSQGFLAPRMNTTQQNAISSPATGLLIYNTDSTLFRFYSGSAWTSIAAGSGSGGSGTVNSGTQYRLAYYATTGTAVSEAAAITANRALISDANGVPTHSVTTATELSYVNGVTSPIQTQLDKEIGIIQSATYTLTSSTSTQKLFDAVANGAITLEANTTYQFDCVFALSSMSATSGNCGFDVLGAGTATFTSVNWIGNTRDAVFNGAAAASNLYANTAAVTGNIAQAATSTELYAHIKGTIRVNAGGTIIPSVNLTNAAAAVVQANSYFKLYPIGNGSVTSW